MAAEELKAAALSGGPTNPFAVAYLQLCQVSYLPAPKIPLAVTKLPPLDPGGSWQCAWGPAQDADQSNLVFVATYNAGPGLPVFAATVIRGTDVDVGDGWGIIEQIWEDLDVTTQSPLPWAPNSGARVAQGTLDALQIIQDLSSGGQSLLAFLAGYLGNPANGKPLAIVTGHSLGGCLTTVVAPWLQFALAQSGVTNPMVPASFAGPTAGNAAFADYYDSRFGYALRYNNTLDVAPFGWGNLAAVETIYDSCGLPIPDLAYAAILGWQALMNVAGVSYAQPSTNNARLSGRCGSGISDWYDELAYQHHTTTYMTLLGGQSVAAEAVRLQPEFRRRSTHAALYRRFGSAVTLASQIG